MAQEYDTGMRILVRYDPQAFVDLVCPGARVLRVHPTRLEGTQFETDAVIEVKLHRRRMIVHIEVQSYNNKQISWRLLRYFVLLWWHYKLRLPVRTYVIYLLRDGKVAVPPHIVDAPGPLPNQNDEQLRFLYGSVEIGRMCPEDLLAKQRLALLAFLPFTVGGATPAVVEQMMQALDCEPHRDLAVIGFLMATLAFKRSRNRRNQEWLQRRYPHMRDILQQTPGYQWIIADIRKEERAQGRAEGKVEVARQAVVKIVRARFPLLLQVAERQVATIEDVPLLLDLSAQISLATNAEQATQYLLNPRRE